MRTTHLYRCTRGPSLSRKRGLRSLCNARGSHAPRRKSRGAFTQAPPAPRGLGFRQAEQPPKQKHQRRDTLHAQWLANPIPLRQRYFRSSRVRIWRSPCPFATSRTKSPRQLHANDISLPSLATLVRQRRLNRARMAVACMAEYAMSAASSTTPADISHATPFPTTPAFALTLARLLAW